MKLKVATYNISGGFYEDDKSVDFFDKNTADDIDLRLLNDTVKIINDEKIDIICFQEIIITERIHYIDRIMENTDLKYSTYFETSPNTTIKDTFVGIAILSKYPIDNSYKQLFTNPRLSKTTSSGNTYYTFDKGLIISTIDIRDGTIDILTHHGFPFRRFNSTPEDNESVFMEFDNIINEKKPDIVTGDFNAENFINMMPYTKNNYIKTIDEATTDDGKKFDNILIHNDLIYSAKVIESLSDHFIVITEVDF